MMPLLFFLSIVAGTVAGNLVWDMISLNDNPTHTCANVFHDPRRLVIWKTNWKTLRSGTATALGGRVIRLPLPYYQGHLLTPAYRPKYVMCVTLIGDTHSCGLDITNQSRRIFYQRIVGRMTVLFKWSLECSVSIVWCFTICLDIYVEVQRMIN